MLLVSSAFAGTYADDFRTDQGRWRGGVVATGVLSVTDGTAELHLGPMTAFSGTAMLRLRSGTRVALSAGDAEWSATYDESGGVTLGADSIPLPTGHYVWEPDAEPVLEPGPEAWDAGNALHTDVLYDDATATWFLFWTGELPPPGYAYRQIGVATSTDGENWTEYDGNPVLTIDYDLSAVDGVHVHMPTVLKDGPDWHMFYSCYQNNVGNRICHATSPDGYAWTPEGVALDLGAAGEFDSGSLRSPDVLIGPDGTWHMLYNGTDPDQHYGPTGHATSPDGWTWTKHGPITTDESRLQYGGMYAGPYGVEQWWNCDDVFCHSTADWSDLTTWEDDPEVTLHKGWAAWNDGYIQAPSPWLVGTTWHMWFNGYTYTDGHERIGHARTVPVPGAYFSVEFAWDGATFTVTQNGATQSMALSAAEGLRFSADGEGELEEISLEWTEAPADTAVDSGPIDSGPIDSGPIDSAEGTAPPVPGDTASVTPVNPGRDDCGCGTAGDPRSLVVALAWIVATRRSLRAG